MTNPVSSLLPAPRSFVREQGEHTLKNHHHLKLFDETGAWPHLVELIRRAIRHLVRIESEILGRDADKGGAATVVLRRDPAIPAQGYRLHVTPSRVLMEASDDAGAYYATMTLRQLIRLYKECLPACRIDDHPDFPVRGILLDVSRDQVPTLETLFLLVDEFAEWKINHLQLYLEHTFAYRNHRDVWSEASPLTSDDLRALDAHCRSRHIELVANQNTFGHMHRWLKHARYRDLAECPDGYVTPWSEKRSDPFSLNPLDPRCLDLVRELLGELLPNFTSKRVNVGCDETFDLGQGRSREACAQRGKGRVYLDYLLQVHRIVRELDGAMMFWGDIILHHPELIPDLPRDVVALVWGYEADHPFAAQCEAFAAAGLPFYVCPGTSTWNSLAGRLDNALANLQSAAEHGRAAGATGYLITDWGDNGHWQTLPISYLPLAAGAALAWCRASFDEAAVRRAVSQHILEDDSGRLVEALHTLGNLYQWLEHPLVNASPLFRLLHQDRPKALAAAVSAPGLRRVTTSTYELIASVATATPRRADGHLLKREIALAARLVRHAGIRALAIRSETDALSRDALLGDMDEILAEFNRVWLLRNRPGGLEDSLRALNRRRIEYAVTS